MLLQHVPQLNNRVDCNLPMIEALDRLDARAIPVHYLNRLQEVKCLLQEAHFVHATRESLFEILSIRFGRCRGIENVE